MLKKTTFSFPWISQRSIFVFVKKGTDLKAKIISLVKIEADFFKECHAWNFMDDNLWNCRHVSFEENFIHSEDFLCSAKFKFPGNICVVILNKNIDVFCNLNGMDEAFRIILRVIVESVSQWKTT